MKKLICITLSAFSFILAFSSCDSPKPQQNGEMFLETAAKNSDQAKDVEQKLNDAALKTNANLDAAMKEANVE